MTKVKNIQVQDKNVATGHEKGLKRGKVGIL